MLSGVALNWAGLKLDAALVGMCQRLLNEAIAEYRLRIFLTVLIIGRHAKPIH